MFKQDVKTITQDAGTFYDTIFNHPKDNVNKEIKSFVREFESNRNNRNMSRRLRQDPYQQDRKQFMDNQNQAKQEFDNEFKEREQKLIKEYRTMMEEALRGVYDPSASVTSNITSGSSSKHNDFH
ncbi:biogenesis of lysosome-related organelles complex 1 subunit 5-like [Gigaspora margarita]|uniref:Biogenesis of lysosome-related organelles complex 1 subunit 5-like n=1 Tax=Gigaspora margarita TaxID=4874 RepID=A0A8H3XJ08_GIGMA|nr:biogenesis of lysosome-related organelles complex 1 subunit 5-like [Gigaspora margarita]